MNSATRWVPFAILPALLALLALLPAGCEVGPDYHSPTSEVPRQYGNASSPPATEPASRQPSQIDQSQKPWIQWWTKFDDPTLNSLITRAILSNHELKIAAARVQEARAEQRVAQSRLYPTVDVYTGIAGTRGSAAGFGFPYGLPGIDNTLYQIGFDATYEVDLFGGIRRSIEASAAFAEATEDERRAVHVTLLAEVARDYIALRTFQRRLAVARDNLADQRQTLDIVQRRFNNGLATNFDIIRARAQVSATSSSIPILETGIRQTIHELSILLGDTPNTLSDELTSAAPIPPVPPAVPVGLPSELLRRRPDILRAERMLAGATAAQGVAVADLFPHLVLGGTAGVQSRSFDDIFSQNPSSGFYLAGPLASWTLFDGGRRNANIDRGKALIAQAAAAYEQTVLTALRDVENELVAYSQNQSRRDILATLVSQDQQAVKIARSKYDNGLITLLDVLEVQGNLYSAQDQLAQSDQSVSTDLVALYKALGGGWESAPDPAAAKIQ